MHKVSLFAFILLFVFMGSAKARQDDLVRTQGYVSAFHRANKGRIVFTSRAIEPNKMREQDAIREYALTNNSDLFFTVFLANSATNYLHRLAPSLTADSLTRIGNYQFTFIVDGQLIHKSNLWPGAPYPRMQDTATIVSKPFIDNKKVGGWWSQFLWNRFMANGGDSALTDGLHTLRVELKVYVNEGNNTIESDVIASGALRLKVFRHPTIDPRKYPLRKIIPCDGFDVSSEPFDKMKIQALKGNIANGIFHHINSVIVIKNGKLLIEEYFNGDGRNTLHDPRSVGKSFASTMTGIAIGEGYLKSEQQTLKEFYDLRQYDHPDIRKENTPLSDLLTMTSVFDGDDSRDDSPGNEENMYPTDNWVRFALNLPVDTVRPVKQWHYFTAGAMLLGDILNKTVPGGLQHYADEKLFRPLHITRYEWQFTPQGVPSTAGGIRLSALDFAKYGQLYGNHGKWKGRQLIPENWVEKTFSRQNEIFERPNEYYGYLFWNKTYTVDGKNYEAYYCSGNGGNKIFVFTDQPLVIVVTASAYGAPYAHPQVDRIMTDFLLPAIFQKSK